MTFDDAVADSRCKYVDSIKCTTNLTQQILEDATEPMHSTTVVRRTKATVR